MAKLKVLAKTLSTLVLSLISVVAVAADYPDKPIHLVVPYAPGGSTDVIGRFIAEAIQKETGEIVVVENRPGATGNLGAEYVARSSPDGYTVLVTSPGPAVINQFVFDKLTYDPVRDFRSVVNVV